MNNVVQNLVRYEGTKGNKTIDKKKIEGKTQNKFDKVLKKSVKKDSKSKVDKKSKDTSNLNENKNDLKENSNIKKSEDEVSDEKVSKKEVSKTIKGKKETKKDKDSNVLVLIKNLLNNRISLKEFNKKVDALNLPKETVEKIKKIALVIVKGIKENNNIEDQIFAMVSKTDKSDKTQENEQLMLGIKKEISKHLLKSKEKNTNHKYEFVKDQTRNFDELKQKKLNLKTNKTKENSSSKVNHTVDKEENFLSKLIKEDKEPKKRLIDKATNFMTQFNKTSHGNKTSSIIQSATVNKNTFNQDIIKSLKFMDTNNMKELTVKIVPKELGEVMIKLTMEGTMMKAKIIATNKEAYNMLNSNMHDINNALNDQNIKIQNIDINIYQGDTTFFSGESSYQNEQNNRDNNSNRDNTSVIEDEANINEQENLYDNNLSALV